jgi:transcriptional regulator with XRE-family HTH domain
MNQMEIVKEFSDKRNSLGLSLRDIARETGVSPSSLSRIQAGSFEKLSFDVLMRLRDWTGYSAVLSPNAVVSYEVDKLAGICEVIRADPKLDEVGKEYLCKLMTDAYDLALARSTGGM